MSDEISKEVINICSHFKPVIFMVIKVFDQISDRLIINTQNKSNFQDKGKSSACGGSNFNDYLFLLDSQKGKRLRTQVIC